MEQKHGYSTTTYKFRLYCQDRQQLYETRKIYNQIVEFYYEVLQKETGLPAVPKQKLLRELELLTIGARGQDRSSIKYPLLYEKVPLYFRRAAINEAIRLMQSYMAGIEKGRKPARTFQSSPVFYKGMYKDFTESRICLKLWNGSRWVWENCCLEPCGRGRPEEEKMQSPRLKLDGKKAMLHVPVVEDVEDIRTVKERLTREERICAAVFPGNDCMAVLAVLNKDGEYEDSLFIRGGSQLRHEKQKLLNRIRKNRESMGVKPGADSENEAHVCLLPEEENKDLKQKIKNLTDTYAHRVSREIVTFLVKKKVSILAVPNYTKSINLNALGYLPSTSYDWLGRRIIKYTRYKAFAEGIVVATVGTKDLARRCYICGELVKRFNKNNRPGRNYYGGKNYICPNGHKGNAYFNSAMNTGRNFLKSQGEIQG